MRLPPRSTLQQLFLVVAFPPHLWTIIYSLSDIEWLTYRTNALDAIAVTAYELLFALSESIGLFIIFALLSLMAPKSWSDKQKLASLASISLVLAGGLAIDRLTEVPWGLTVGLGMATSITVLYSVHRFKKFTGALAIMIEKISLLTLLYLVLDGLGIALILYRNFT